MCGDTHVLLATSTGTMWSQFTAARYAQWSLSIQQQHCLNFCSVVVIKCDGKIIFEEKGIADSVWRVGHNASTCKTHRIMLLLIYGFYIVTTQEIPDLAKLTVDSWDKPLCKPRKQIKSPGWLLLSLQYSFSVCSWAWGWSVCIICCCTDSRVDSGHLVSYTDVPSSCHSQVSLQEKHSPQRQPSFEHRMDGLSPIYQHLTSLLETPNKLLNSRFALTSCEMLCFYFWLYQ